MGVVSDIKQRGLSLKARLLIFSLCISLIPITTIISVYYINVRKTLKQETLDRMTAVAQSRKLHVLEFVEAKKGRAVDFSSDGFIRDSLEAINDGQSPRKNNVNALNRHLLQNKKPLDPDITLIEVADMSGRVVASTNAKTMGRSIFDVDVFLHVRNKIYRELYISQPHHGPIGDTICISVSSPVVSRTGRVTTGIIINHYKEAALSAITANRAGMGETGEVLLGRKEGNNIIFMTTLRYAPHNSSELSVPVDSTEAEPMRLALKGGNGVIIAPDYRNESVVAAYQYLSPMGWGLVAKIDKAEAFAPLRMLGIVALVVWIVTVAVVVCVGIVFAVSTSRPIKKLTEGTSRLASGDLNYRVKVERSDELGVLGNSFNNMAEDLEHAITAHRLAEKEVQVQARQQAAIAALGMRALAGINLSTLMNEAVTVVARTLDVEYCKVLEMLPDGKTLLLRAGTGWKEGYVGQVTVGAGADSQAGYTLMSSTPVVVEDLATETRFSGPRLLLDHGVVSGMSVVIQGRGRPFGVMGAHTSRRRTFTTDDVHFLEAAANVIAEAIEHERAEAELHKLSLAVEQSPSMVVITDTEGRIEYVNPTFCRLTGYNCDELIGQNPRILKSGKTSTEEYKRLWDTITSGGVWRGEFCNKKKNGELYWESASISSIKDAGGAITHFIAVAQDITERRRLKERLDYIARYDAVTNMPNRFLFRDILDKAVARSHRRKHQLGVLFIYPGRLSNICKLLEREVCDTLIQTVAGRLTDSVRRSGDIGRLSVEEDAITIGRIGEYEFGVLLAEIPSAQWAARTAQRILTSLSEPFIVEGREFHTNCTIGIAIYPSDGRDAETLLKNAAIAKSHIEKAAGKSDFQFYSHEMGAKIAERMSVEQNLHGALKREEFVVYYQPQVSLETGQIVGMEALIRWNHPERGLISPLEFIPVAEESGLIVPIGEWVLRTACTQSRSWYDSGLLNVRMAVNFSPYQFQQRDPVGMVERITKETGVVIQCLELEITESVLMKEGGASLVALNELNQIGVQIVIDDFGTGYSSLSYLKRFPISKLKIDQSFARHIPTDPDTTSIVRAIVAMAQSLHLKTVAEGVETEEQLDFLRTLGCEEMQGYLFSRPVPAEEATRLLAEDRRLEL